MKIEDTLEYFTIPFKPISRPGTIKRQALKYIGKNLGERLSKAEMKKLEAKAQKIKKSAIKNERFQNHQLVKQFDLIEC
jgi:Ca2+-binding EF-hand superfamily protein